MKAAQRKDQILETSKRIFSEKGYYETHVEEIIRQAKVGKGTFYRYFKNKEELFTSLLVRFLKEWEEQAFVDPSQFNSDNLIKNFRLLTERTFRFFEQNKDLCNIYLRIGTGLNEVFEQYMQRFETKLLNYIAVYLRKGQKLGQVREDLDEEMAVNMLAGAFFRVTYNYFVLKKGKQRPSDIKNLANDFFAVITHGILHASDRM